MNTQTKNITKKTSTMTLIVFAVSLLLAVLLTVSWFLPVATVHGEGLTMLDTLKLGGYSKAELQSMRIMIWVVAVLYAISVIWAAIPKMWAAIVGLVYSFLPLLYSVFQVNDWKANRLELAIGPKIMVPLAVGVLLVSIVKLVFTAMDKSRSRKAQIPAQQAAVTE